MSIRSAIDDLKREMKAECIEPEKGLGEELFLFSSSLAPMVNVDLLITNENKQILLSWRNDKHCGEGWHIPGGCIRLRETFEERIQRTAKSEIGTSVTYNTEPIKVFEIFAGNYRKGLNDQRERSHAITIAYSCCVPEDWDIEKQFKRKGEPGYLKWFEYLPDNLLSLQECYQKNWNEISRKLWRTGFNE